MKKQILLVKMFFFLVVPVLVFVACYIYLQDKEKPKENNRFNTVLVNRGNLFHTIKTIGKVYPKKIVNVGAQVSGEISKLSVQVGDYVEKGDLVAEIDARTKKNAKLSAIAELENNKAELAIKEAALTKVQLTYARHSKLYKKNASSKSDVEKAYLDLINNKNAVIKVKAKIRQNLLTIENADVDLSYTRVNTPISGRVMSVSVEKGQTVNATNSIPTIAVIAQTNVMTVKVEIAEADILMVKENSPIKFNVLGKESGTYTSVLSRIDPAPKEISDGGSLQGNNAIYYYGHIDIKNTDNKLRYGMTAMVSIEIDKAENVLVIPISAVKKSPRGSSVMVLKNEGDEVQTELKSIEVGLSDGFNVEVTKGLSEEDVVIISHDKKVN